MAHAERYGNPLSIAYVELNDFERLHSDFGTGVTGPGPEDSGRRVCRYPAHAGQGRALRWPHLSGGTAAHHAQDANAIAERLRRNVAGRSVHHAGQDLKLAIAIGATQFRKGDDLEKLLERAREAVHARPPAPRKRTATKAARPAKAR